MSVNQFKEPKYDPDCVEVGLDPLTMRQRASLAGPWLIGLLIIFLLFFRH